MPGSHELQRDRLLRVLPVSLLATNILMQQLPLIDWRQRRQTAAAAPTWNHSDSDGSCVDTP